MSTSNTPCCPPRWDNSYYTHCRFILSVFLVCYLIARTLLWGESYTYRSHHASWNFPNDTTAQRSNMAASLYYSCVSFSLISTRHCRTASSVSHSSTTICTRPTGTVSAVASASTNTSSTGAAAVHSISLTTRWTWRNWRYVCRCTAVRVQVYRGTCAGVPWYVCSSTVVRDTVELDFIATEMLAFPSKLS